MVTNTERLCTIGFLLTNIGKDVRTLVRMEDEGRRMEDVELIPSRSYLNFIEVQVRSYKFSAEKHVISC